VRTAWGGWAQFAPFETFVLLKWKLTRCSLPHSLE
jgi:hypothetical protein